jgi:hypothetical protein
MILGIVKLLQHRYLIRTDATTVGFDCFDGALIHGCC